MDEKKIEEIFGNPTKNSIDILISNLYFLNEKLEDKYNFSYPFFKGKYNINFYDYIKNKKMNEEGLSSKECMDYISPLYQNIPNWKNPGTMINIIPPVNIPSLAAASLSSLYNSNFAQDTYAGYLIASELEVIKYISDLVGYNWEKSGGLFTFGGKSTNLYATKIALNKSNKKCSLNGIEANKYFILTTKTCHPCHYQVCDWVGIGKNNCYEVPCDNSGSINIEEMKRVIENNIKSGKVFLGINLNGGNTNELVIDPIKKVYNIISDIQKKYKLKYRPHIHVDSVIGWVYSFYNEYDFNKNDHCINTKILKKIELINKKVKEFKYADSLGIDFHKTGFCAYTSSLFILKNRLDFELISEKKLIPIKELKYGNYNPYDYSLELSRSSMGAISALVSLKTIGIKGFQDYLCVMQTAIDEFKTKIKNEDNIYLLNEESSGFATLFIITPKKYNIRNLDDILKLNNKQIEEIKKYNVDFSGYLLNRALNNEIDFYFTSSRSYIIPGTAIKIGALKAYPSSIYFNEDNVNRIVNRLLEVVDDFQHENPKSYVNGISDSMVYKE